MRSSSLEMVTSHKRVTLPGEVVPALPLPDDALETGSVLDGRYRIDGVIGGGGMASVYRAEHLAIARPVAIKVLHAGLSNNRDAVARFHREATTSGRLVHPNIVTVTDAGVLPDGRCYLVMEALDGETLADRLEREERIPWRAAVDILRELLLGLRHAHEHGVVHRDIKPENIFIVRGDGRPSVKILDFGIAKLRATMASGSRLTQDGLTIGTPLYMSPEQVVDGEITPASDLYSSTVVLFEMLTGEPPFYDEDPIALMKAHLHEPPPRLDELAPALDSPEELEDIVRRGLAKLVAERIPSADDYLQLLDQLRISGILRLRASRPVTAPFAGEIIAAAQASAPMATAPVATAVAPELLAPVALPLPPVAPGPQLTLRRDRRLVVAGALLVAAVAIPVIFQVLRESGEQAAGAAPLPPAEADAVAPAHEVRPTPEPRRVAAPAPTPAPAPARPVAGARAKAPAAVVAPAPAPAPASVKQWVADGNLALGAGRFDEAGAQFRRAIAADGTAHAAHAGLAEVAYNKGDFASAAGEARRAVALAPNVTAYRMMLAKAYYKLQRFGEAIAQWQMVLGLDPGNTGAKKYIELARAKKT